MRNRVFTTLAAGAALLSAGLGATGAAAQAAVDTYSNFAWRGLTPPACAARASASVDAVAAAFGVAGAQYDTNTFRVLARTDDLNIFIYCFADDGTPAFDGPGASRVLVAIYVSTSRGAVGGEMRDFLAACMEAGICPGGPTVRPKP